MVFIKPLFSVAYYYTPAYEPADEFGDIFIHSFSFLRGNSPSHANRREEGESG